MMLPSMRYNRRLRKGRGFDAKNGTYQAQWLRPSRQQLLLLPMGLIHLLAQSLG